MKLLIQIADFFVKGSELPNHLLQFCFNMITVVSILYIVSHDPNLSHDSYRILSQYLPLIILLNGFFIIMIILEKLRPNRLIEKIFDIKKIE